MRNSYSNRSDWYFGTDGNVPNGRFDFVSVVLHEIGHGLGFIDSFTSDNRSASYEVPPFQFDTLIENENNQNLINTFPNFSQPLSLQLASNNLFIDGNLTTPANNNSPAKIYAPNPYSPGSSIAHWDESTFPPGNPNALMTPFLSSGEANHNPGPITLALFRDLGWQLNNNIPPSNDNFNNRELL